jgi:spore germination protein KC
LRILEQQQTEYVKEEIKRVIEQTRLNGTDIFGFGEAFYRSNPVKWEKIKDRWEEIYRNLNIEYDVRSIINRSYNVENQIGTKKIRKKNASY